ncbi:MAG: PA14 domain-containing protein [Mycobacterium sp.]|nr:PA14 domain-containing protein [Mycobacterium sp.]
MTFSYNSQEDPQALSGLTGSYFDARSAFGAVPTTAAEYTFDGKTPLMVRRDASASFNWVAESPADAVPSDHFLARLEGSVRVPTAGAYTFGVRRDGGARVWVDGAQVFNGWTFNVTGVEWASSASTLGAAQVPIKIEYYEEIGDARLELWVRTPSGAAGPAALF